MTQHGTTNPGRSTGYGRAVFDRFARRPALLNPKHPPYGEAEHPHRRYVALAILIGALVVFSNGQPMAEPVTRHVPVFEPKPTPPRPDDAFLARQPEPDCELRSGDADERQRLDYERQCYRHAEMIVRGRLHLLQGAIEGHADPIATVATATRNSNRSAPKSAETQEAQRLIAAGERHLRQGNVAVAREYFARAVDSGSVIGALKMAATFDQRVLALLNVRGVKSDPAEVTRWYHVAMELEVQEAETNELRLSGP